VILHIFGPNADVLLKAVLVSSKQCSRRFLKTWGISGRGRHEAIRRLLALAYAILANIRQPRFVDQLAEYYRCAAALAAKPLPMAGQQGDLSRDDAQPRAPASATASGSTRAC